MFIRSHSTVHFSDVRSYVLCHTKDSWPSDITVITYITSLLNAAFTMAHAESLWAISKDLSAKKTKENLEILRQR
eukprot:UN08015